jgi:Na+/H+ antiporter NhaB
MTKPNPTDLGMTIISKLTNKNKKLIIHFNYYEKEKKSKNYLEKIKLILQSIIKHLIHVDLSLSLDSR